MKKTILSTFLFIIFLLTIAISYLTFFGYETDKFNKIVKSEIKKSNNNFNLDFTKISILLDIKKISLFVKFINPSIDYFEIAVPLESLRADIDLEPLLEKKLGIKKVLLTTKYLQLNEVKPLINKIGLNNDNLKKIQSAKFKIKNLELEFDKNFKLKQNFNFDGNIDSANLKVSDKYKINNLATDFTYQNNNIYLSNLSLILNNNKKEGKKFFNGSLDLKKNKKNYEIDLILQTKEISRFFVIPIMNYSFLKDRVSEIEAKILLNNDKSIFLKNINIEDIENNFKMTNLHLDKNYNLVNFDKIEVKTSLDNNINNDFKIINEDKIIISGKVFDASLLVKELSKKKKDSKFFKKISKDIEIDITRVLKGANFPIKNFRLIGNINKGNLVKISAKSDFSDDEHLEIEIKEQKKTKVKTLEIRSHIATPLISDYKFFKGLDGGELLYISKFDKKKSENVLTIKDFKLNNAPTLAKILTLADLKGLTDTLKGEGISFDMLSIKYTGDSTTMTIEEIFMIGPSISILVEGYVEKKSGLVSLRGTLVPAKQLNKIVAKIPVVGEILVGKKVGEGIFGLSFKIKGFPNDLKTTVNPVKTLAPRFITRAVEAAKKRKAKQQ